MNYLKPSTWKLLLLVAAVLIVAASLWYTNLLAKDIAREERKQVELWANAYKNLNEADETSEITFLFEVIKNNETVPVILTDDEGNIKAWRNIDSTKAIENPNYLRQKLELMRSDKEPLAIEVGTGQLDYIYYQDSYLLTQLKYYPYVQLGIIAVFLVIAYLAFSTSKAAEQNQLWVGMAKETAHQLGTPISSLVAWVEILKDNAQSSTEELEIIHDIEKDVSRLELVAERFSKIGSKPELVAHEINRHLEKLLAYVKRRASDQVNIELRLYGKLFANINPPLFEWVIENLLKNALDAISGKGEIIIEAKEENKSVVIDVKDSGKGIPKSDFKTVFQTGFSTKKRGWGLGLSLSKRIIEQYHSGNIFVKESVIGKGTVFRIVLPK